MHTLLLAAGLFSQIIVQRGDTLWHLAEAHHTTVSAIVKNNPQIKNPNLIYPGERLKLGKLSKPNGSINASQQKSLSGISKDNGGIPFHSDGVCNMAPTWPVSVGPWVVPGGCFSGIYRVGYGDCFGWVHHLVPALPRMGPRFGPKPGQVVHFPPGRDGASDLGHWAYIISVHNGWMLISEENMVWRGAGYNRVNYRFVPITPDLIYY